MRAHPTMTATKCGHAIIRSLLEHGIDTVFGIPGGQTYELFDGLHHERARLRLFNGRHEQGVAYMAFGYAQASGRPAVYTVVPGPGVLNSSTALSTAYACNQPVLCLAGTVPLEVIGRGIGFLHDLPDQSGVLARLTKWSALISRPGDAQRQVARAFREMRSGRPGPAALEIPPDVLSQDVPAGPPVPVEPCPPIAPDPDLIRKAACLLAGAKRPLIYVGGGARAASEEIRVLAELLQAPVVAFRSGRGVVSDRHYLSQSFPAGQRLWSSVDVVLAVGTRLKYPRMHWGEDEHLKIIHIDVDRQALSRISEPAVGIVGDAKLAVAALVPEVERVGTVRESREEELTALKHGLRAEFARLQPQMAYLEAIRQELPDDGIFVDEVTQVGYLSWYALPVYAPRTLITAGYTGNLGYGYATAVGAQIAHPRRKLVAISGDGGFLFNGQELSTAVKYSLNVVSVVFRDEAYGNVARAQTERYGGRVIGTELRNPDFVKLAEAFGATGLRATTPAELTQALRRAFAGRGPAVIEVPLPKTSDPWRYILLPKVRGVRR